MPKMLELANHRYGRLLVVERTHRDLHGAWMWRCVCDCGKTVIVRGTTLNAGRTKACASCATSVSNTTHGMTDTPLYQRWRAMLARTTNPGALGYHNYGGRGIAVCDRWLSFEKFAEDVSDGFSRDLQLDRINNDLGYSPENCRWVSFALQQRNKRTNHVVTWSGRTLPLQDWADLLGLRANTLLYRLRREWPVERALTKDANPVALLEIANKETTDA